MSEDTEQSDNPFAGRGGDTSEFYDCAVCDGLTKNTPVPVRHVDSPTEAQEAYDIRLCDSCKSGLRVELVRESTSSNGDESGITDTDLEQQVVDLLDDEGPMKISQVRDELGETHNRVRRAFYELSRRRVIASLPDFRYEYIGEQETKKP